MQLSLCVRRLAIFERSFCWGCALDATGAAFNGSALDRAASANTRAGHVAPARNDREGRIIMSAHWRAAESVRWPA